MILTITNDDGKKETREVNSIILPDVAAIADDDLPVGCCQFWVDETNHKLMVKTKYADGTTVKTATVCSLT